MSTCGASDPRSRGASRSSRPFGMWAIASWIRHRQSGREAVAYPCNGIDDSTRIAQLRAHTRDDDGEAAPGAGGLAAPQLLGHALVGDHASAVLRDDPERAKLGQCEV